MKKPVIIVEGLGDELILKKLLPAKTVQDITFNVAGGASRAVSIARTLPALGHPVVLVLDAETTNDFQVAERRETLEHLLRTGSAGLPCLLLLQVPSIETLLAPDRGILEKHTRPLSDLEWQFARAQPDAFFKAISEAGSATTENRKLRKFLDALSADEIARLREQDTIRQLVEFVESVANGVSTPKTRNERVARLRRSA
jgi:hypothetical protein